MEVFSNRPLVGIADFIFSSIGGKNPFIWQVIASLNMGISAVSIHTFIKSLLKFLEYDRNRTGALAGTIFYLAMPWTLGLSAWPLSSTTLLSFVFFSLSGIYFLKLRENTGRNIFFSLIFTVISYLFHESFYFQFLILMLIVLFRDISNKTVKVRKYFAVATPYAIIQVGFIFWNRFGHFSQLSPIKKFEPSWPTLLSNNFNSVSTGFGKYLIPMITSFLVVYLSQIFLRKRNRYFTDTVKSTGKFMVLLAIFISGIAVSVFVYTVVGYGISFDGMFSRTTIAMNFWLTIIIAMVISWSKSFNIKNRILTSVIYSIIFIIFCMRLTEKTIYWHQVWELENKILMRVPVEKIDQSLPESIILYRGMYYHKGIIVFGAPWDLGYAIVNTYPELRNSFRDGTLRKYAVASSWINEWSGSSLTQYADKDKKFTVMKFEGKKLFIWDYDKDKYREIINEGLLD